MAPLVVIVGPTASGKTALAVELAEQFGGEIICADSRTVYKYMDIGTAKPTAEERKRVPHHGVDLVEPGERFSAADFKAYAQQAIGEIRNRGNVPFLVGGTGLYVDAVVYDYEFGSLADSEFRRQLESMTLEELHDYSLKNNIKLPENKHNKRYVIRAIEQRSINNKRRSSPVDNTIIVGIATSMNTLMKRITQRSEHLFDNGMVEEAITLGKRFGWNSEAMTGNIYPLVRQYLSGEITDAELRQRFIVADRQLAKRQLTWLRRRPYTLWMLLDDAKKYISHRLVSSDDT